MRCLAKTRLLLAGAGHLLCAPAILRPEPRDVLAPIVRIENPPPPSPEPEKMNIAQMNLRRPSTAILVAAAVNAVQIPAPNSKLAIRHSKFQGPFYATMRRRAGRTKFL